LLAMLQRLLGLVWVFEATLARNAAEGLGGVRAGVASAIRLWAQGKGNRGINLQPVYSLYVILLCRTLTVTFRYQKGTHLTQLRRQASDGENDTNRRDTAADH